MQLFVVSSSTSTSHIKKQCSERSAARVEKDGDREGHFGTMNIQPHVSRTHRDMDSAREDGSNVEIARHASHTAPVSIGVDNKH